MSTVKTWKGSFKDWITIPLIGAIVIALIVDNDDLMRSDYKGFFESVFISFVYWSSLANGNSWIIEKIDQHYTWLEAPVKRTIIGVVAMIAYTVVISLVLLYFYLEFYFKIDFFKVMEQQGYMSSLSMPLIITAIVALWGHGKAFLLEWRQAAIDVEKLKSENLKSQFESLKSQVNPHFLFNSLNALSSLVYDNQDRAVEFIQELSKVYRYVLDHQNDEVVELNAELAFLKSYVYLNKIRFGDNLNVEYQGLDSVNQKWMIPPVALQMLMENVLKHNEISKDNHLNVVVSLQDDKISIQNNINPLQSRKEDSSGLGLNNIKARYKLLTDKSVEITESPKFVVTLPLLTVES